MKSVWHMASGSNVKISACAGQLAKQSLQWIDELASLEFEAQKNLGEVEAMKATLQLS